MAAVARWYFDADTIGLGKLLRDARHDVTWPGDTGERSKPKHRLPPCVITESSTPDHVWIPTVTSAGLAIVTRDRHIQTRTAEINAVLASRARMFAITSNEQLDNWGLLEVFVSRFRDLQDAAQRPGPYIYSVTRSAIRELHSP